MFQNYFECKGHYSTSAPTWPVRQQITFFLAHLEEINNDDLIFFRGFMSQHLKPIISSTDRALNILGLGKENKEATSQILSATLLQ